MTPFFPIREKPQMNEFTAGDYLVLFGELFQRGYANGLVEQAQARGMHIIYSTVGRREKDNTLRCLNPEELEKLPTPLINIPLEAGFDLEFDLENKSICDYLKDVKLSDWKEFKISKNSIIQCKEKGQSRFQKNVSLYLQELKKIVKPGKKILFAHLMAGGVPRAKILMPLMNRVFKGRGDRYLASEEFWSSNIGQLVSESFDEVTAGTFDVLIQSTQEFKKLNTLSYIAYGYHGTEILINNQYSWQTYSPYLQGWAKIKLEEIAEKYFKQNISVSVYNCPEILTNSSSIFQGVEVPLYPLIAAIEKEEKNSLLKTRLWEQCQLLLKEDVTREQILKISNRFLTLPEIQEHFEFSQWPTHSTKNQMELLLQTSDDLIGLHKDEKQLITQILSEIIFKSAGYIMLNSALKPQKPVMWIGHDIVAQCL